MSIRKTIDQLNSGMAINKEVASFWKGKLNAANDSKTIYLIDRYIEISEEIIKEIGSQSDKLNLERNADLVFPILTYGRMAINDFHLRYLNRVEEVEIPSNINQMINLSMANLFITRELVKRNLDKL